MDLFMLRHASAGTRRTNPLLDLKRPLDKEGKRHCLHLAQVLNAQKIQFDLIVSSPLKRSLQTASLISNETGYETKLLISKALAPTASLKDFYKLLRDCTGHENVLVVGHNPTLSVFLGALLVPRDANTQPSIRLRKGSLARLTLARGAATLQGLLDPRTIRALYATSTKSSLRKTSRK
ncbi:MAG: histidine phosphatase family protein [Acidobacteriaceae bacterium]